MSGPIFGQCQSHFYALRISSGSLAIFAAIRRASALLVVVDACAHVMPVLKGPPGAVRHSECLKCKKHCYRQGNTSQKRFHGLVSFYSGCNNRRDLHSAL
jgi:hypothetical protein